MMDDSVLPFSTASLTESNTGSNFATSDFADSPMEPDAIERNDIKTDLTKSGITEDFAESDLTKNDLTEIDKIRQQFNYGPYPRVPLDDSPKDADEMLYLHSYVTSYYLRHRRVPDTNGKVILDAGCGSGFKALMLAEANPGAKIVGIDLSEESVKLAQRRLEHHGFTNTEFHVLRIEELPKLGMQFDYINCDEVLYLLPDPAAGLAAMKAVLQPDGLIRANLHSAYQRANFFRAQELFRFMGLMDTAPQEFEEDAVIDTMKSLKDHVKLKAQTWLSKEYESLPREDLSQRLAMNLLFVGDTGYKIPDIFEMLEVANLEFVSMVNWRHWDVTDLFQNAEELPDIWSLSLATASIAERLYAYELLNPVHRLLDFWCTHPGEPGQSVDEWKAEDWKTAIVHLHPQLRKDKIREELINCVQAGKGFEISQYIRVPALDPIFLEPTQAANLLPLWDGAQPIQALVDRYCQIRPIDPVTLAPLSEEDAFAAVKDVLNQLDAFLYVLIERGA
jgi:2-polyprenyl-3-methyl-5-hydroxy-6-metoxy-1,4-benzoquinol methylase